MITQTSSNVKKGIVQDMRSIREQISLEIKDMTFEQERAYLDKLLSEKKKARDQRGANASGSHE